MATRKTGVKAAKKKAPARKKKTPAAKKRAPRKRAATPKATPAPPLGAQAAEAAGDRLTEVAKTIGSTVGEIVAKTNRVLHREP